MLHKWFCFRRIDIVKTVENEKCDYAHINGIRVIEENIKPEVLKVQIEPQEAQAVR